MTATPHNRPDRPPSTPQERERLRLAYPEVFKDGAVCGFVRHFDGEREHDGFPCGFHRWQREKRNAWLAGFAVGFADWLANRYPEFERELRQGFGRR